MNSVVELYDALLSAPDERARASVIAEALRRLEERCRHRSDMATQGQVRAAEYRFRQELEQVRADSRRTEQRLHLELTRIRADLSRRIEQQRFQASAGVEQPRGETAAGLDRSQNIVLIWLILLMFAQVGAIAALVKLL